MDNNLEVLFYEKQAEKFLQKKTDVARGVIELGKILIETKEKLPHGSWIKWLEDSRVGFTRKQAAKYMRISEELGDLNVTHQVTFDTLSLNKLYSLASAPEEVKEEVAILEKGKFPVSEYFIESAYKTNGNNKTYNCYLVTKMGCEMLGNKLQAEKGTNYTIFLV